MARYNSVNTTGSVAGGNQITTPASGLLTTLTGSGTVTVPNPVYYTGQSQTFYNASGVTLTLGTPSGVFTGPGASGTFNQTLANGAIITIVSDGTNYVAQAWLGGAVSATSITSTGAVTANPSNASISLQPTGTGTITVLPGTVGTIDKMNIGATTAGTGAFTALTSNGATTFTSSSTITLGTAASGALQVTGGVGVGGGITVASDSYFGGKLGLGVTSPSVKLHVSGSAILSNSTSINPDSYTSTVVAGGISFPAGWGVSSGLGGNAGGAGKSWGMGHNGVNWYLGMGNNAANDTQQSYMQMMPNRDVLFVPTSGNVGIGVAVPGAKLEISMARTSSTSGIALYLTDTVTGGQTDGVYKSIRSGSNGGNSVSEIRFLETDGTNNNTGIAFATQSTAGALTERMRINNSGHLIPGANDTYDLGAAGAAWRNVYTNDLHLNNESKVNGNDIDGTTGNWTIQEGAEDLYIVNNKTGKRYAFALREIE